MSALLRALLALMARLGLGHALEPRGLTYFAYGFVIGVWTALILRLFAEIGAAVIRGAS